MKKIRFTIICILFMIFFFSTTVIGATHKGFWTNKQDGATVLMYKDYPYSSDKLRACSVTWMAQYLADLSNTQFREDFFNYDKFLNKILSSYQYGATYKSQVTYKSGMCLMHGAGGYKGEHYKITGVLTIKWDNDEKKLVTTSEIQNKTVTTKDYGAELSYVMHLNDLKGTNNASTKYKYTIAYYLSKRNKIQRYKSTKYILCSICKFLGRRK